MNISKKIKKKILETGPISIDEFINIALYDRENGYYMKKSPIGKNGDFITAPEISQLFGEIIALWVINSWEKIGKSEKINLVEIGPGRGTLMHDILRVLKNFSEIYKVINLIMIEVSPSLTEIQKNNLSEFEIPKKWFSQIDDFESDLPNIIIANELFDALPIKQYLVRENIESEILIGSNEENQEFYFSDKNNVSLEKILENIQGNYSNLQGDKKHIIGEIGEDSSSSINNCKKFPEDIFSPNNYILEKSPLMAKFANKIKKLCQPGSVCIIDYGYFEKKGISTLQALKNHKYIKIFENLGEADITAHVDFLELASFFPNCYLMTQREFLKSFGIDIRLKKLLYNKKSDEAKSILSGYNRLIDEDQMGNLFKVLLYDNLLN